MRKNKPVTHDITVTFSEVGIQMRAKLYQDGKRWCVLSGEDMQSGFAGFGSNVNNAVAEFRNDVLQATL